MNQERRVARQQSIRPRRVELLGPEHAQHHDTEEAAHAVNAPHIERIVPLEPVLERDRIETHQA